MARTPTGVEHLELEGMSDGQLWELIQQARETLSRRIQGRLEEFRALAREAGFEVSLTKVGEGDGQRRRRRSAQAGDGEDRRRDVSPKYRNPDNASETWSGRGRKPRWLEDRLSKGAPLEGFLIGPVSADAPA
jgi:DNA-binding protein H-NS